MTKTTKQEGNEELWRQVFGEGHPLLLKKQKRFSLLPHDPRCKMCYAPFSGIGGFLVRLGGLVPSDRNPNYCNKCDGFLAAFPGGSEVPMTMLFLDIRDSVNLSGQVSAKQFADTVNKMREDVSTVLADNNGFVLEFQGDSVVAVFPPGFTGMDHAEQAIKAAKDAVRKSLNIAGTDEKLPVGIGVHTGEVYICTVTAAGGNMQGIGVFGHDVNLAARLAAKATSGQALISLHTYKAAGLDPSGETALEFELKGVEGSFPAIAHE